MSRCGQRIGVVLGLGVGVLAVGAAAQEYCVACQEPPGLYRCVIDGAKPGGRYSLKMLCVVAMTKEGGHGACSVKGGTVFDCNGPVKRVPWAAYNAAEPAPDAPPTQDRTADGPPQTVVEMVERANEKTAEQIRETNEKLKKQAEAFGEGVGDATRKTWRCISSLLTRCGQGE